jgi:hypothetical protein
MTILSAAWNVQDFSELTQRELELVLVIDKTKI